MSRLLPLLALSLGTVLPAGAVPADPPPHAAAQEGAALPDPLTLREALRLFRERGYDLLIAEAQLQSAQGDAQIATAVQNPAASVSLGKSLCPAGSGSDCTAPAWTLSLGDSNLIFDVLTGKRSLRGEAARAALAAARGSYADAQRTLTVQLKQGFIAAALAQAQVAFAQEAAASSWKTANLMQRRYAAGAISQADVARTRVAALEADRALDVARQAEHSTKAQLAFLLGVRTLVPPYAVESRLVDPQGLPPPLPPQAPHELLERAQTQRPDLLAAQKQEERAQAAVALARRQRIPDIALNFGYAQQGSGSNPQTPPTFSLGASANLPLFYQQQGEIAKAEADLRTQRASHLKVLGQVANDIQSGLGSYDTSRRLVERMHRETVPAARTALDLVRIQVDKGAGTLLDLLDAQRTFIATHGEYLQDLSNYWTAVFQLEQAVGQELVAP